MNSATKAERLAFLAPRLRRARVLPSVVFTRGEWNADSDGCLRRVAAAFPSTRVIVRSSVRGEDAADRSLAGAFRSVGEVDAGDPAALRAAVEAVARSYDEKGAVGPEDQFLVQAYLRGADRAGVLFTRDPRGGGPYHVTETERGGTTTLVTSGRGGTIAFSLRGAPGPSTEEDPVHGLGEEVEGFLGGPVDLEFAEADGAITLLQARPLRVPDTGASDERVRALAGELAERFVRHSTPDPFLRGRRTILGVMPDWNPAEMIGTDPSPLAASLYERLVTDSSWREARARLGYADARPAKLLSRWGGKPYIDCRASFHSFLPSDLCEESGHRAVDAGLDLLERNPERHDKVEFEVVSTCFTFAMEEDAARLRDAGLAPAAAAGILEALHRLTDRMVREGTAGIARWLEEIAALGVRRRRLEQSSADPLAKARILLDDARASGVLPFAVLARFAFVGAALLRSLEPRGAMDRSAREGFFGSIRTVASEVVADLDRVRRGGLDSGAFLARHGHLRPGTYDLRVPRYDEAPDRYFARIQGGADAAPEAPPRPESLGAEFLGALRREIERVGFRFSPEILLAFVRESVRAREYAKYEFTRNVSEALRLLAEWGRGRGLAPDDLSWLEIDAILGDPSAAAARDGIDYAREESRVHRALRLPPLITRAEDFFRFTIPVARPNFVTDGSVVAPPLRLAADPPKDPEILRGRVLFLEAADPGFDWVFAFGPAGLVTKYGGANSHMAIRSAEFSLPAAIGCGEAIFDRLAPLPMVHLDARAGILEAAV